ncbi:MAG: histidine kinase [Bacillota bacterium]|jgi:sensor histidine kinase YesM
MKLWRSKRDGKLYFALKWKLIAYSAVFILLTIFGGFYLNLGLKMSTVLFKAILNEYKYLEVVGQKVYGLKNHTENFLADDIYVNLEKCYTTNAELRDSIETLSDYIVVDDSKNQYEGYLDLVKCLERLLDLSEKTVSARRAGTLEIAYSYNYQMVTTANLVTKYLAELMNRNTVWGQARFQRLTKQTQKIEYCSYCLAAVIGLLCIVFCVNFSLGITRPLQQMVQNAAQIGEGNFLVNEVLADSDDELQVIAKVFNRMARNIHALFEEIQQKAQLEEELKEEKLYILEMENVLRATENQILQSQVNPHFLYNTLNAVSQVAILEDAAETGELIKAVARLLRYSLQSLERPVTVAAELAHIKEYLYIMGVRYSGRVICEVDCQAGLEKCLLPCMTLQPILENAYIHGVGPLMPRPGRIRIAIKQKQTLLQISIADNGVGMAPEKLAALLNPSPEPAAPGNGPGRSSGLGLNNIRKRLESFFHWTNLLTVGSKPGEGTIVTLRLPIVEEAKSDE